MPDDDRNNPEEELDLEPQGDEELPPEGDESEPEPAPKESDAGTPEDAAETDPDTSLFGGQEIPKELEPIAKGFQSAFTKKMQELADAKRDLDSRISKLDGRPQRDPADVLEQIEREREERARRREEEANLSPEEVAERRRKAEQDQRLARIEARQNSIAASDAFVRLTERVPAASDLEKPIADKLRSDPYIRNMVSQDPTRAVRLAYTEVLEDMGTTEAEILRKHEASRKAAPAPARKKPVTKEDIERQRRVAVRPPAPRPPSEGKVPESLTEEVDRILEEKGASWDDVDFDEVLTG